MENRTNGLIKPDVGVYSRFWDYNGLFYRRLIDGDDFTFKEAFLIGKELNYVNETHCYKKIPINNSSIFVYINPNGLVLLPISKTGRKIKTNKLNHLADLPIR